MLGDFNACIGNLQVSLHDRADDALYLQELEPKLVGLDRSSNDRIEPSKLIGDTFYSLANPMASRR